LLQGLLARTGRSTPLGHAPAGLQDFAWRQHLRLRLPSARLQRCLFRRCLLGGDLGRPGGRTLTTQLPLAFGHCLLTQGFLALPVQFAFCQLELFFSVHQLSVELDIKTPLLVCVQAQLDGLLEFQVQANLQVKKRRACTRQHRGLGVQGCLGGQRPRRTSQLQFGRQCYFSLLLQRLNDLRHNPIHSRPDRSHVKVEVFPGSQHHGVDSQTLTDGLRRAAAQDQDPQFLGETAVRRQRHGGCQVRELPGKLFPILRSVPLQAEERAPPPQLRIGRSVTLLRLGQLDLAKVPTPIRSVKVTLPLGIGLRVDLHDLPSLVALDLEYAGLLLLRQRFVGGGATGWLAFAVD